jgi:hypothetical protein
MVAGGVDLNPSGDTTATPRRRPVREWPAPVPQDGDDFLRRRPADAMTLGWQKFTDPAGSRRPTSVPSLQYESSPGVMDVGGLFFEFEAVRTASGPSRRVRGTAVASMASSRDRGASTPFL